MTRIRDKAALAALALVAFFALPEIAMAADGEGLYGRTTDKAITFFSFGVIAFFAIFVIVASWIQHRLDTRKERVREEIERLQKY